MNKTLSMGLKAQTILSLGLSSTALSQAQADLGESTVIAARADQEIDSVIASIFSEDPSYFAGRGIHDLSEALDSIAGINASDTAGQRGASRGLLIRGLPTSGVQLRVDGVRISNSSFALNNYLGSLSTGGFDRIEVLKGSQSSLYGDGAVAGVVNLSTDKQTEGGEFFTDIGSFDSVLTRLNHGGREGDFYYRFQIGTEYSENDTYGGNSEIPGFDNDFKNLFGNILLSYDFSEDFTLGATYRKSDFRYENPQFGGTLTDSEIELGTLFADWQIRETWNTSWTVSNMESVIDSFSQAEYKQRAIAWENALNVAKGSLLSFGAEVEKSEYVDGTSDADEQYAAIYSTIQQQLPHDFSTSAGLRFENYDSFGSEATWNLGLAYEITSEITVKASTGTAFTAPTMPDLYAPSTAFVIGNPNLGPETSRSWEVTLEYEKDESFGAALTYFETLKESAIQRPFFASTFNQEGRGVANGVELSLKGKLAEQLSYVASTSYLDNQLVTGAADQFASLSLIYQATDDLELGVNAKYEGDRVFGEALDAYTKVDLFSNYKISKNVLFSARVENIFEEKYSYFTGFGSDYPAARLGASLSVLVTW
jgi:vitamin B12 transporter